MDSIRLAGGEALDLNTVTAATLNEKGASKDQRLTTLSSGQMEETERLIFPEDVLIIELKDGGEIAVRGDEAEDLYAQLADLQNKKQAGFSVRRNGRQS